MEDLELKSIQLSIKENLLWYRYAMISQSDSWIINTAIDQNYYLELLDMISYALSKDENFFYLNDYIEKTQYIINTLSYKFNTKGDIREVENSIKIELNKLNSSSEKQKNIEEYLKKEFYERAELPYKENLIYESMANDFAVFKILERQINEKDKVENIGCSQFIQSTSYFTNTMPELYELYPSIYEISSNYLKKIKKDNKRYKKYIKRTQKKLDEFKS